MSQGSCLGSYVELTSLVHGYPLKTVFSLIRRSQVVSNSGERQMPQEPGILQVVVFPRDLTVWVGRALTGPRYEITGRETVAIVLRGAARNMAL